MPRLRVLAATTLLLASALACSGTDRARSIDQGLDSLSIDTFLGHMTALSSDAMAGRRPGTAGYDSAAAYLVRESQALGLEPGGGSGKAEGEGPGRAGGDRDGAGGRPRGP